MRDATLANLSYLYGLQAINYLFPLVTLPYLARVLGPEGFGKLAVAQALGQYLYLFWEYGFTLSATREAARLRNDTEALRDVFRGVFAARLILLGPTLALAYLAGMLFPILKGETSLILGAFLYAFGMALSPIWVFQALEKMAFVAALEFSVKLLALLGVFWVIRGPSDVAMPLYLQGSASLLVSLVGLALVYQRVGFAFPRLGRGWSWLKKGFSLFFFRVVVSLYTTANVLIVSVFLPPAQVALYAGAERITKALIPMWEPFSRLFLPRFSFLIQENPMEARRLASKVGLLMLSLGIGAALALWALAPWVVEAILGSDYLHAVPLIRVLVWVLPFIALSNFLGIQWMLAHKMDRPFNAIIALAGILNVMLALALVPPFGSAGMAWSVLLTEGWVAAAMGIYLWRARRLPWRSYDL